MSQFNPDIFLNTETEEAMETRFTPIPEGEYTAIAGKPAIRTTPRGQVLLDVPWSIDDQSVKEVTGLPSPSARQSIFLDVTETGGLAGGPGKNIGLGRLREAVGLNVPGQSFKIANIEGKVAKVVVKQRVDTDTGDTYVDVKRVAKLS